MEPSPLPILIPLRPKNSPQIIIIIIIIIINYKTIGSCVIWLWNMDSHIKIKIDRLKRILTCVPWVRTWLHSLKNMISRGVTLHWDSSCLHIVNVLIVRNRLTELEAIGIVHSELYWAAKTFSNSNSITVKKYYDKESCKLQTLEQIQSMVSKCRTIVSAFISTFYNNDIVKS